MQQNSTQNRTGHVFLIGLSLVLGLILSRWVPHPPNMTPVVAIALWAGLLLGSRFWGVALPVVAMFLADLWVGFHSSMLVVYGALMLISIAGISVNMGSNLARWGAGTFGGSALFFVITNLGVWFMDAMYPMTASGLAQCFTAALPFWGNQLVGDFAFSAVLFMAFHGIRRFERLQLTKA